MLSREKKGAGDHSRKLRSSGSDKRTERAAAKEQQKRLRQQRRNIDEKNAAVKKQTKLTAAPKTSVEYIAFHGGAWWAAVYGVSQSWT